MGFPINLLEYLTYVHAMLQNPSEGVHGATAESLHMWVKLWSNVQDFQVVLPIANGLPHV